MNIKSKKISIYSVAKLAGVSPATVSRVLNQSASVNLETRQKVLKVVEESDFRPRQARNRPGQIGFVIINDNLKIDNYKASIMEGVMRFCAQAGFDLSMIYLSPSQAESKMVVKTIMEHSCDVVILHGKNTSFLKNMHKASIPVVVVGDQIEDMKNVYYVDTDNILGTRQAMEHLLKLGHRKIALFCANMSSRDHEARLQAYNTVLQENGIAFDPDLVVPLEYHASSMEAGRLTAEKFLAKPLEVTAIVGMSDEMVYGILRALHDKGIKVPEEISLVSFDDYEISGYIEPPLTSVKQPLFEMGEYAARVAMMLINKAAVKDINKIVPTKLTIRKSTAAVCS
jgi:LacI family transcriptional regulator